MEKKHYNLVIATPGFEMTNGYVKSLVETLRYLDKKGLTYYFANGATSNVFTSREITLSGSRHNDINDTSPFQGELTYDKILWIDSDISWTPEDVIKLYESDKDVVTGAYLLANGSVAVYKTLQGEAFTMNEVKESSELHQAEAAGFGFICFKKGVFESMERPWFQMLFTQVKNVKLDKLIPFPISGEDFSLCARLLNGGYEIWLDASVKVGHQKTLNMTWEGISS